MPVSSADGGSGDPLGSTLSGLSSLLGTLFGSGTTATNQNTNSDTNTSANSTNNQSTSNNVNQTQNTSGVTNTGTTGNTVTKGTVDPLIGGVQSSIVSSALAKASDPGAIKDLISSTLNSAATSFGETTGNPARGSGLYDSSTMGLIKGYAEAQATSQAVSNVLNYQTQQETVASNANAPLLSATSGNTQSTNGTTSTTTQQLISSLLQGLQAITGTTSSTGTSNTQATTQGTSSNGGILGSVICTEMYRQGKLDKRLYVKVTKHFNETVSDLGKEAYHWWARFAVRQLQEYPDSKLSDFICSVTESRALHVTDRKTVVGWLCKGLFTVITVFVAYGIIVPSRKIRSVIHV